MCLWIHGDAGALRRCPGVKELLKGTYLASLVPDQLSPVSNMHVDTVVDTHGQHVAYAQTLRKTECSAMGCSSILSLPISIRSWQRPVLYLLKQHTLKHTRTL